MTYISNVFKLEIKRIIKDPAFIIPLLLTMVFLLFYNYMFFTIARSSFAWPVIDYNIESSYPDMFEKIKQLGYNNLEVCYTPRFITSSSLFFNFKSTFFSGFNYLTLMIPLLTVGFSSTIISVLHSVITTEFKSGYALLFISNYGRKEFYKRKIIDLLIVFFIMFILLFIPIIIIYSCFNDGIELLILLEQNDYVFFSKFQFNLYMIGGFFLNTLIIAILMYFLAILFKSRSYPALIAVFSMIFLNLFDGFMYNYFTMSRQYMQIYLGMKLVVVFLTIIVPIIFLIKRKSLNLC